MLSLRTTNRNLLIIFLVLLLFENTLLAQDKRVTLYGKGEYLWKTLTKLSNQTGISFIYGNSLIEGKIVSYNISNESLTNALDYLFDGLELAYEKVSNTQILLFRKEIPKITISGVVIDSTNGECLPYSNISLIGTNHGVSANKEGRFILGDVKEFPCTLKVHHIGYLPKFITINSYENESVVLKIKLSQTGLMIGSITVESESSKMLEFMEETSWFTVSPEAFSFLPRIGENDISRSLQLFPGITASSFGASGIHIRGGLPSENLIMLDGIRIYHMNHLFGFFTSFNPSTIKDVQVIKGCYPAKYGGKLSGVVELTAKSGNTQKLSLNISGSQSIVGGVAEIPISQKTNLLVSARRSISDFIMGSVYEKAKATLYQKSFETEALSTDTTFRVISNKDFYFYDVLAKFNLLPSSKDLVSISFFTSQDILNSNQDVNLFRNEKDSRWGNKGLGLKWYRDWGKNYNTTFIASYSNYFTKYCMNDDLHSIYYIPESLKESYIINSNINNDFIDLSFQLENEWTLDNKNKINFGIALSDYNIEYFSESSYLEKEMILGERLIQNEKVILTSAYLQDNLSYKNFEVTGGIRTNYFSALNKIDFEPRFSVNYSPLEFLSFNMAYGYYNQYILQKTDGSQVLDGRISWVSANKDQVKPSHSRHFILGGTIEFPKYLVKIEYYHKNQYNIFDVINNWQYIVLDDFAEQIDGVVYGIDFLLQKKSGNFTWWASYGLSFSEFTSIDNSIKKPFPSNQDSPHNLSFAGNYEIWDFNLSFTWKYSSGKPYNIPNIVNVGNESESVYILQPPSEKNNKRLPATHQMDMSLTYNFPFSFISGKVGFSIFNLYDKANIWHRSFSISKKTLSTLDVNMLGRTITLFIDLRL
ncbi:MAG: TonB-dependent receptor [Ignavibacteria bacterium]|jgi:hypothetical protein